MGCCRNPLFPGLCRGSGFSFLIRHFDHAGSSAAGDAVFEDCIHVILHQAVCIIFFLDLFQRFLAGRFHVAALRVFEFNDNAGVFVRNFDQDVAVAGAGLGIGREDPAALAA